MMGVGLRKVSTTSFLLAETPSSVKKPRPVKHSGGKKMGARSTPGGHKIDPQDYKLPPPNLPQFYLAASGFNTKSYARESIYTWPQTTDQIRELFKIQGTMFPDNVYDLMTISRKQLQPMVRSITNKVNGLLESRSARHILLDGPSHSGKSVLLYQMALMLSHKKTPVIYLSNLRVALDGKELYERDPETGNLLQYAYVLRVLRRTNRLNKALFDTIDYKGTTLSKYIENIAPSTAPAAISQIEDISKLKQLHTEFEQIIKFLDSRGDLVMLIDDLNALYSLSKYPTPEGGFHTPKEFAFTNFILKCISNQDKTIPSSVILSASTKTDTTFYSAPLYEKIQTLKLIDSQEDNSNIKFNKLEDVETPNFVDAGKSSAVMAKYQPGASLNFDKSTCRLNVSYFDYYELTSFLSYLQSHGRMFKEINRSLITSTHTLTGGNPIDILNNIHDPMLK